ncbi:hypothetical protein ACFOY2_07780 [Nonomuraea purpurea]|uniref:Uncharacterized protein n=1 Tax=Nonomuraea purpurea TaxID=1849276 RepID=A0ABV8G200_9ACTN
MADDVELAAAVREGRIAGDHALVTVLEQAVWAKLEVADPGHLEAD